ncbi:MAG: protein kinase [Planctomycetota bacterium]
MTTNLLATIAADALLRERLASMPTDEKTVTLALASQDSSLEHPDWAVSGKTHAVEVGRNLLIADRSTNDPARVDPAPDDPARIDMATGDEPRGHGASRDPNSEGFANDTLEQTLQPAEDVTECEPEWKVPLRRVASLSDGNRCDAEYRLIGELGSGGTGVVYQAHQRAVDREVAIKVLRPELASDASTRHRFLAEAQVIGGLDHPNVIALHELCVDDRGGLFYSMKRIDGASWDERIKEMSVSDNVRILLRVADAIRYAHSRGLIHRDIKPGNVMLGQYGETLLADWGLAIQVNARDDQEVDQSAMGGTPAYMAPELAVGDPSKVSIQTDVYLLGAILFEILSGFPPHTGANQLECIEAAAENRIRETDASGELLEIAMKAMATDPKDRFSEVAQMIDAIENQRVHRQSIHLVRRAETIMDEASKGEQSYEPYRLADAVLREAIEAWPGNQRAHQAIRELQRRFAAVASASGDLDLALSLYEKCGEGESEIAQRIRRARDQREQHARGESKYSTLFTRSPDAGILTRLSDAEILEANDAFFDLLGYALEDVVGSKMPDLHVWKDPDQRVQFITEIREQGRTDGFETTMLRFDGTEVDVLISARSTKLNNERVLITTLRDISLRKHTERKLERSRRRLAELQRLAGLGTWSVDLASQEIRWSDELYQLVGRDPERGTPSFDEYLETIHPDDREELRRVVDGAINDGSAYELVLRQGSQREVDDGVPESRRQYRRVIARGQPSLGEDLRAVEMYGIMIPMGSD